MSDIVTGTIPSARYQHSGGTFGKNIVYVGGKSQHLTYINFNQGQENQRSRFSDIFYFNSGTFS